MAALASINLRIQFLPHSQLNQRRDWAPFRNRTPRAATKSAMNHHCHRAVSAIDKKVNIPATTEPVS